MRKIAGNMFVITFIKNCNVLPFLVTLLSCKGLRYYVNKPQICINVNVFGSRFFNAIDISLHLKVANFCLSHKKVRILVIALKMKD